jgi:hypothetical protein
VEQRHPNGSESPSFTWGKLHPSPPNSQPSPLEPSLVRRIHPTENSQEPCYSFKDTSFSDSTARQRVLSLRTTGEKGEPVLLRDRISLVRLRGVELAEKLVKHGWHCHHQDGRFACRFHVPGVWDASRQKNK